MERNKFYYDGNEYKILEPNKELKEEILVKLINLSKEKKNKNSFDAELTLWLLQKLVVSDNEQYNFNNCNLDEFISLLVDSSIDLEFIINMIYDISSKIQMNFMLQQKLNLRNEYIKTLILQINEEVENIQKEFFKDVKFEKQVEDIKRINDLNRNGLNDKRKEVERLNKIVQKSSKKKLFGKNKKKNK